MNEKEELELKYQSLITKLQNECSMNKAMSEQHFRDVKILTQWIKKIHLVKLVMAIG